MPQLLYSTAPPPDAPLLPWLSRLLMDPILDGVQWMRTLQGTWQVHLHAVPHPYHLFQPDFITLFPDPMAPAWLSLRVLITFPSHLIEWAWIHQNEPVTLETAHVLWMMTRAPVVSTKS